jgi:hypothetical protein
MLALVAETLFCSPNPVHSYTHDTLRLHTRMIVLYIRGVCVCVHGCPSIRCRPPLFPSKRHSFACRYSHAVLSFSTISPPVPRPPSRHPPNMCRPHVSLRVSLTSRGPSTAPAIAREGRVPVRGCPCASSMHSRLARRPIGYSDAPSCVLVRALSHRRAPPRPLPRPPPPPRPLPLPP